MIWLGQRISISNYLKKSERGGNELCNFICWILGDDWLSNHFLLDTRMITDLPILKF